MQIGLLGLGRMGANMARRLRRAEVDVVAWNRNGETTRQLADETGIVATTSVKEVVALLDAPRIVWLMLPAGAVTEQQIAVITPLLSSGDLVVDGGNSFYRDSQRHGHELAAHGLCFVDAGVSGGIWGLEQGYALMLGGEGASIARLRAVIEALAPDRERGWLHCGPAGAGHFVKMVHNGIEYGMLQAYAEGFALMKAHAAVIVSKPQHLLPKHAHVLQQSARCFSFGDPRWFGKRSNCGETDAHRGELFGAHQAPKYEANTHGDA